MQQHARHQRLTTQLLARADIVPGGGRPWDMQVHDASVYSRISREGSLGLGETYLEGLWDCASLDQMIYRIMRLRSAAKPGMNLPIFLYLLRSRLFNLQNARRSLRLRHYDIGNDLYQMMLDKRLVYSCAVWDDAATLDQAQEAKLELVCRKIGLRPDMKVLDIGCGWGSFMKYAAEKHGAICTGVTISPAQAELGRALCAGLPVEFRLQDYRAIDGKYDAVVSIGMFEHVGRRNYRDFMQCARRSLKRDGLLLLHTIGARSAAVVETADPWLSRYIFPNGELPGLRQIADCADQLFVMEDWHNFGADYDRTLLAWHANFAAAWPELAPRYGEEFRRMWTYYLLSCAGLFRARTTQLWQVVFSPRGIAGGYHRPR